MNGRELAVSAYLEEHVIPCLIGRDPQQIEDIWQHLAKGAYRRRGPVTMSAIAAVDMALWDIKAKIAGQPLYQPRRQEPFGRDGLWPCQRARHTGNRRCGRKYLELGYKAVRAQSGVPGLDTAYGIARGKLFYEPATKGSPRSTSRRPRNTSTSRRSCSKPFVSPTAPTFIFSTMCITA